MDMFNLPLKKILYENPDLFKAPFPLSFISLEILQWAKSGKRMFNAFYV